MGISTKKENLYSFHKRNGGAPIKSICGKCSLCPVRSTWIENYEEGLLTESGRFLSRKEAMTLARENGQLRRPTYRAELNSEDLW